MKRRKENFHNSYHREISEFRVGIVWKINKFANFVLYDAKGSGHTTIDCRDVFREYVGLTSNFEIQNSVGSAISVTISDSTVVTINDSSESYFNVRNGGEVRSGKVTPEERYKTWNGCTIS